MDRQSVFSLSLFGEDRSATGPDTNSSIQRALVDFILEFHLDNVFLYRSVPLRAVTLACD